jgi:hypothetical protein
MLRRTTTSTVGARGLVRAVSAPGFLMVTPEDMAAARRVAARSHQASLTSCSHGAAMPGEGALVPAAGRGAAADHGAASRTDQHRSKE